MPALPAQLKNSIVSIIARRWRELVGFALLFRAVECLLFAPIAALVGKWLLGQTVLDSTAIVSFLLSPRGFLALIFAAVIALSIRLIEHAGLSSIFFGALQGRRVSSRQALRLVGRYLLTLMKVATRLVGIGLVTMLPLIAVAAVFAARLLPRHDINYYLKLRPPEFINAVWIIGFIALITVSVALSLIVRWRWVVQAVLFEQRSAGDAFAESATLTCGRRWKLLLVLLGVVLFSLALGLLASVLGGACTTMVLALFGHSESSLALTFTGLLLLRTIIGAVCTFLGSCVDAGAFTTLYQQRRTQMGGSTSLSLNTEVAPVTLLRWLPATLIVGMLAIAAATTWLALDALSSERMINIHAHRGVFTKAPENTLAAVREAIAVGADYVETDVQLSKDDVLVVVHDSDFSRLGGVAKKVWDLTYDEIQAIPLGRNAAPEVRQESTPSFDALLAETKGRIKVNIELKYYGDHQPGLARKVIEAVRAREMTDQVLIQCLEYEPLMEVHQLAPEVPIGYLLSINAIEPSRLKVDFLSVEQNRLDRAFIVRAHRRGQQVYAWTVNTAEDMERLLDLGIDGVITDQAALARQIFDQYLGRPPAERAVRRVRAWLAN